MRCACHYKVLKFTVKVTFFDRRRGNTKRLLAILLSSTLLLALMTAVAAGDSTGPYTASISSGKCKNGKVSVAVFVGSETAKSYNAFWLTLAYDTNALEFTEAVGSEPLEDKRELQVSAKNGVITVAGCGDSISTDRCAVLLCFKVNTNCVTKVQLLEARVSDRSQSQFDAKPAKLDEEKSVATVTNGYYQVALPANMGLYGDAAVAVGKDYTFQTDPHYDYTFTATADDTSLEVADNGDGSYTVRGVTGPLKISNVKRTPKIYSVTVAGSGSGDVQAAATATYGQDFHFAVNQTELMQYAVSAVVDGRRVSLTNVGNTYTIAGEDVTGPVTITVAKVTADGTTLVLFVGSGAEDVDGGTEQTCRSGSVFTFSLNADESCDYVVLVEGQTLQGTGGRYTIPANLVSGAILTVSVTKTTRLTADVRVSEYLSGRVWLVEASLTVPVGKMLTYDGAPMLYVPARGAYMYVVDAEPTTEQARRAISTAVGQADSLTINGDANDSGLLDVNDAQLVYDMYMGMYRFNDLTQPMWLRADANGDQTIDILDVQCILQSLAG